MTYKVYTYISYIYIERDRQIDQKICIKCYNFYRSELVVLAGTFNKRSGEVSVFKWKNDAHF